MYLNTFMKFVKTSSVCSQIYDIHRIFGGRIADIIDCSCEAGVKSVCNGCNHCGKHTHFDY